MSCRPFANGPALGGMLTERDPLALILHVALVTITVTGSLFGATDAQPPQLGDNCMGNASLHNLVRYRIPPNLLQQSSGHFWQLELLLIPEKTLMNTFLLRGKIVKLYVEEKHLVFKYNDEDWLKSLLKPLRLDLRAPLEKSKLHQITIQLQSGEMKMSVITSSWTDWSGPNCTRCHLREEETQTVHMNMSDLVYPELHSMLNLEDSFDVGAEYTNDRLQGFSGCVGMTFEKEKVELRNHTTSICCNKKWDMCGSLPMHQKVFTKKTKKYKTQQDCIKMNAAARTSPTAVHTTPLTTTKHLTPKPYGATTVNGHVATKPIIVATTQPTIATTMATVASTPATVATPTTAETTTATIASTPTTIGTMWTTVADIPVVTEATLAINKKGAVGTTPATAVTTSATVATTGSNAVMLSTTFETAPTTVASTPIPVATMPSRAITIGSMAGPARNTASGPEGTIETSGILAAKRRITTEVPPATVATTKTTAATRMLPGADTTTVDFRHKATSTEGVTVSRKQATLTTSPTTGGIAGSTAATAKGTALREMTRARSSALTTTSNVATTMTVISTTDRTAATKETVVPRTEEAVKAMSGISETSTEDAVPPAITTVETKTTTTPEKTDSSNDAAQESTVATAESTAATTRGAVETTADTVETATTGSNVTSAKLPIPTTKKEATGRAPAPTQGTVATTETNFASTERTDTSTELVFSATKRPLVTITSLIVTNRPVEATESQVTAIGSSGSVNKGSMVTKGGIVTTTAVMNPSAKALNPNKISANPATGTTTTKDTSGLTPNPTQQQQTELFEAATADLPFYATNHRTIFRGTVVARENLTNEFGAHNPGEIKTSSASNEVSLGVVIGVSVPCFICVLVAAIAVQRWRHWKKASQQVIPTPSQGFSHLSTEQGVVAGDSHALFQSLQDPATNVGIDWAPYTDTVVCPVIAYTEGADKALYSKVRKTALTRCESLQSVQSHPRSTSQHQLLAMADDAHSNTNRDVVNFLWFDPHDEQNISLDGDCEMEANCADSSYIDCSSSRFNIPWQGQTDASGQSMENQLCGWNEEQRKHHNPPRLTETNFIIDDNDEWMNTGTSTFGHVIPESCSTWNSHLNVVDSKDNLVENEVIITLDHPALAYSFKN